MAKVIRKYLEYAGDPEDKTNFLDRLTQLVNLNQDLIEEFAPDNFYDLTDIYPEPVEEGEAPIPYDDPIITPPLYGQWHADQYRASSTTESERTQWFQPTQPGSPKSGSRRLRHQCDQKKSGELYGSRLGSGG